MPDPFARPLARVDEQLASLVALQRDTAQQLDSVRRQITELEHHELNLVGAHDGRAHRIDLLLDERLRSAADEERVADTLVRQ